MNILYINHYAGSLTMGMEFRPFYLAQEWKKKGHNVRIVACTESHLRKKNIEAKDGEITYDTGIPYQWFTSSQYKGNGIKRAINILIFAFKTLIYSKKIAAEFKPDIVIASSTYPLDIFPSYIIARYSKAKLIHEVHDLWPLTLTTIYRISKWNPFIILLQIAENFSYKKSDKVVSMLPGALEYMQKHGLTPDRFVAAPNGVRIEDWPNETSYIDGKSNEACFTIGYAGYHGVANDLENILLAIEQANLSGEIANTKFHFIGEGPRKEALVKMAKTLNLSHIVEFHDPIPKKDIPKKLSEFDALILSFKKDELYKYGVSPNKLLDYMMAGKPIIQALDAYNNWVSDNQCGYSAPPDNPKLLAEAIVRMIKTDKAEREMMGQRGKEFVLKNLTYSNIAEKFLE